MLRKGFTLIEAPRNDGAESIDLPGFEGFIGKNYLSFGCGVLSGNNPFLQHIISIIVIMQRRAGLGAVFFAVRACLFRSWRGFHRTHPRVIELAEHCGMEAGCPRTGLHRIPMQERPPAATELYDIPNKLKI